MHINVIKYIISILLLYSCNFENKKSEPRVIEYHEVFNEIKSIKRYKDGKLHGESIWFYITGALELRAQYRDGKVNGFAYFYYPSGSLKSIREYKDGKLINIGSDYWDNKVKVLLKVEYFYTKKGTIGYAVEYGAEGNILNTKGSKELLK